MMSVQLSKAQPLIDLSSQAQGLLIQYHSTFHTGIYDEGAAEITAYDPVTQRLFFINASNNQLVALKLSSLESPTVVGTVDATPYGGGVNSVDVYDRWVAIAVEGEVQTDSGRVVLFHTDDLTYSHQLPVGPLPDMLVFTDDGTLLTANEGQPSTDYSVDPPGSVSIIRNAVDPAQAEVVHAGFEAYSVAELKQKDVRISVDVDEAAKDLEPEYIAVSLDGSKAYVTLQENNAMAIVDLASASVTDIVALGAKDHRLPTNALDVSDRDNAIAIETWPISGLYMPDGIATFDVDGQIYVLTANEGDSREFGDYSDEVRMEDLSLDASIFPPSMITDEGLGRLQVMKPFDPSHTNEADEVQQVFAFGTRSMSIWDDGGTLLHDTGSHIEETIAELLPNSFNSDNAENDSFDARSDAKGPEPEAVSVAKIGGRALAFLALERVGGVMIYDVSQPDTAVYVGYVNGRNFDVPFGEDDQRAADLEAVGESGPEKITLIAPKDHPVGKWVMVVSQESTGSISFYTITVPMQTSNQHTEEESVLSKGFTLFQNTPNPFNPETRITFELMESTQIALSVYDLSGKKSVPSTMGIYRREPTRLDLMDQLLRVECTLLSCEPTIEPSKYR
jgi:DNA-binding beta-propeller fold protein YncE